jgi:O-antigen/teichoic acid export membrane protein
MNTVQRIAKNTGVLLASQIASYIFGFFFIMYTARYLGAEGFGILSFALAFTGIFCVFSDLGLSILTIRGVARDKSLAGQILSSALMLSGALNGQ